MVDKTPTPNDDQPGDGEPQAPDRSAITVSTLSDSEAVAEFARKTTLETTSHVAISDVDTLESLQAPDGGETEGGEGAQAAPDGAPDTSASEDEPETAAGEDAGADGSDASDDDDKPKGRRARKMARLRAQLDESSARIQELESKLAQADSAPLKAPDADDFASWDEYAEAKADYLVAQKEREKAGPGKAPSADAREPVPESWGEVEDKYDDFQEVAYAKHLRITDAMADNLTAMGADGAELLYQLGKHPEEAKRIARVSGNVAVARELGKFEAKIASNGSGKRANNGNGSTTPAAADAPRVSSAPRPISRTEGGVGASADRNPDSMTPAEYRQWRESRMKARGEL